MKRGVILFFSIVIITVSIFFVTRKSQSVVRIGDTSILVTIANEPHEQINGLSGREKLDDDHGMLFIFSDRQQRLFWMNNMKFPIDIIWINDGRVSGITSNIAIPHDGIIPEAWSPEPVSTVLEVSAYYARQHNIATGTMLTIIK